MSTTTPSNPRPDPVDPLGTQPGGFNGGGAAVAEAPGPSVRRGRAAVTLRDDAQSNQSIGTMMDPATKSLAEALDLTYRLLLLAIGVLAGIYLLSAFQTIEQNERGIRVVLGRPVESNLEPGPRWSLPAPIGEIVKVRMTEGQLELDTEFFPALSPAERAMSVDQLANGGSDSLNPEQDGSLITADGSIVHTRVRYMYRRADVAQVHRMFTPESERQIVAAAVRRGVVHAASMLTIDEFLKGVPDDEDRLGTFRDARSIALEIAQQTLADTGIEIDSLELTHQMPPRLLAREFNLPLTEQANRKSRIEGASEARRTILSSTAGVAADTILRLIDLYEERIALNQNEAAEQTLAQIQGLLRGEPVEIDGRTVNLRVDGRVPSLLADARQYRTSVVARAQSEAARFRAVRDSYLANPEVVVTGEWADALRTFLARDTVQTMILPSTGQRLVMQLNRDPDIARAQERTRAEREFEDARRQREAARARARFEENVNRETVGGARQ